MKALVLGAAGHIGAHITRALLSEGVEVRAAYRNPKYLFVLDGLPLERVQVDLDTHEGLDSAIRGCDWIFHAAGFYPSFRCKRERAVERGIDTIRRACAAFLRAGASRIVFTSSASTIRRVPGRLASEADAESWPLTKQRPLYPTVKIVMEQEILRSVREEGLPAVIVNPSVCLGEYDAHPFSGRLILLYAKGRMPVTLEHTFNAIYTGDVGLAHVRAAQKGCVGERYLLSNEHITLKELAVKVAQLAGVRIPCFQIPYPLALIAGFVSEWGSRILPYQPILSAQLVKAARQPQLLDNTKAIQELAMPQTPIEEAIQRALAWFSHNNYCK